MISRAVSATGEPSLPVQRTGPARNTVYFRVHCPGKPGDVGPTADYHKHARRSAPRDPIPPASCTASSLRTLDNTQPRSLGGAAAPTYGSSCSRSQPDQRHQGPMSPIPVEGVVLPSTDGRRCF